MVYQIHSWGHSSEVSLFDPSSQLLAKLISPSSLTDQYEIIPDSDIFNSHSGRLPTLNLTETQQIVGFEQIWNFIITNESMDESKLSAKEKIIEIAIRKDLIKNLEFVTLYNFFVIKKNYEGFTRPEFSKLLPWPTQYKAPVDMKNFAFETCLNEGIIDDESGNVSTPYLDTDLEEELKDLKREEKNLRDTPVINELQKSQMDKQIHAIELKKSVIANMQCIKILKSSLAKIENNDDKLIKTILLVFLKCNTSDALPENFIKVWLAREHPRLSTELEEFSLSSKSQTETSKISLIDAIKSSVSQLC